MKILYISKGESADFLCDTLFHGLRTLLGPDVVDVERLWFTYENGFENRIPWHTFYGLLPDDRDVDRTDISSKIRNRYFDFIFYGSVHRCRFFLPEVLEIYPTSKIVFIDGEDDFDLFAFQRIEIQNMFSDPPGYTIPKTEFYFKRELSHSGLAIPIQFSIPKEKIVTKIPEKTRLMAPMDPRDRSTYKYPTQAGYFAQYSDSCFGVTMKKGGWDCARHYEIIAAGAIPYFENLEECPVGTLTFLPKSELILARKLCDSSGGSLLHLDMELYQNFLSKVRTILDSHLTTEAMAKYVLDRVVEK